MISMSFCMIVRNEEDSIARCLDCVKDIVDEIIVVDTGSTDRTKEIASQYTNQVVDFEWIDDFSAARNFAFSLTSLQYIFYLDADDILLEADQKKLIELKQTLDPSIDSVTMEYHVGSDGAGQPLLRFRQNRLLKRANNFQWIGAVHEYVAVGGNIINSDIAIVHSSEGHHHSNRNLMIYENRLAKGEEFTPRDLYYYANELNDHKQYEKAIEYYEKFLDTKKCWVEDEISTCNKLADCFTALGDRDRALEYAFKSFLYELPRAEACCKIGFYFLDKSNYKQAAFWFKLASQLERPKDSWGFFNEACWTWLPHLELCACYDRLGDKKLAFYHNEIARSYQPDNPSVLYNKKYFEDLLDDLFDETGE